jgi:pimeloyl-ACP methyl ester carboxylesterase
MLPRLSPRDSGNPLRFVVLPGLDGTGLLLQAFAAELRALGPVEVRRYPTSGPQDYASLAAMMAPVGAGDVLVAESFGGPLAIALAARAAPRALVLCASFASSPRPGLRPWTPLLRRLPLPPPRRFAAAALFGRRGTPALSDALGCALAAVPMRILQARLSAALCADRGDELQALRCPLLYLRASVDRLVPPTAAKTIARLRPDAVCIDIAAPHGLLQVAVPTAVAAIARFLADAWSEPRKWRRSPRAATRNGVGMSCCE